MQLPAESERYFGFQLQFGYKSKSAAKEICQEGQPEGHLLFVSWFGFPKQYVSPSSKEVIEVEYATEWYVESSGRPLL
jgi:hypothetical protein